ncbi:MAG: cell division protein FtsZ [Chloroflexi bacterium RBG_13_60_13]|nr:MAG: cell division protein FtsZ [Chloroflexi bacterium RBG_13_60_13]
MEQMEIMKAGDAGRTIARIKVIGVGGGGCNAVRRMMHQHNQVRGVEYAVMNTDVKSLELTSGVNSIHHSIQIGSHLTQGFGAGGDAKVGELAARENMMVLQKVLRGADLVFIAAGMGGGTGTGSAPVVAEIAREAGALVVAVVTTPFSFEGAKRAEVALGGLRRLIERVHSTIVVPNDHLLRLGDHDVPVREAFAAADRVVAEGITAISELVNIPGEINCDLADVKKVMSIPGIAIMTTGRGEGPNAAEHAAEEVIFEPLLETHVHGAKGVLFTFTGGPDLTLGSVQRAATIIAKHVDPAASIFFGMNLAKEELTGQVKINLVATGIRQSVETGWFAGVKQNVKSAAQVQPGKLTRLSMKYA